MYERIVQLTPKAGRAWWRLGMLRYRAKDYPTTRPAFEKTIELDYNSGSSRYHLAMIHWRVGDEQAARDSYKRGVEWIEQKGPSSKQVRSRRAEAAKLLDIVEEPDSD